MTATPPLSARWNRSTTLSPAPSSTSSSSASTAVAPTTNDSSQLLPKQPRRRRSSSIKAVVDYVKTFPPPGHHLLHLKAVEPQRFDEPTPLVAAAAAPRARAASLGNSRGPVKKIVPVVREEEHGPRALRWVQRPGESFHLLATVVVLYVAWQVVAPGPDNYNPFTPLLFLSGRMMADVDAEGPPGVRYGKAVGDLAFLGFWVVFFSWLRQASTLYAIKPLALRLGIKKGRKLERFMEQGYAVLYFTVSSFLGLYVMRQQDSWWYRTEYFFLDYPHGGPHHSHGGMTFEVKLYYLLQFSYWLQQALVMIAGLEKKRDDYVELILHHVITLWLVGVSYSINMTQIGIAIFVSMDIPDVVLAVSKCINYVALDTNSAALEMAGNCSFIVFMITWGYLRHYQNIRILYACMYKYHLIPARAAMWDPAKGFFLPTWARYHVFTPIFLLQLVITFWSFLILRIVARMLMGRPASDVREEAEDEGSEMEGRKKK